MQFNQLVLLLEIDLFRVEMGTGSAIVTKLIYRVQHFRLSPIHTVNSECSLVSDKT